MNLTQILDKTDAVRRRPTMESAAGIDRGSGKFVDEQPDDLPLKIHVSKPKGDEVLSGGVHIEKGDDIVHLQAALDVLVGDVLIYWGREHQVVWESRPRYDTLKAVVGYDRRRLLVRELKPSSS